MFALAALAARLHLGLRRLCKAIGDHHDAVAIAVVVAVAAQPGQQIQHKRRGLQQRRSHIAIRRVGK